MSAPAHAWLRRLSDYHSGDVSDAERRAVEEHLATCAECGEALAMYRRFYALLQSPLRLDGPNARTDQTTIPNLTATRQALLAPRQDVPPPNRRLRAGLAAALAAGLIIAGFVAIVGPRLRAPVASGTPTPRSTTTSQPTATAAADATLSPSATQPAPPSAFVCANPSGSSMTYAYIRGDGRLYSVTGCGAPRQLTHVTTWPLAWSPSNHYLAAWSGNFTTPDPVEIIDTQTGAIIHTQYAADFGPNPQASSTTRIFLGWLDDNTFLGGVVTVTNNTQGFEQAGPTALERVDIHTGAETSAGHIPDWANINNSASAASNVRVVAQGREIYYAGYDAGGTTAHLHRFDLTTGTDTQLVSLGKYTDGGCQGTPLCGWTAPWDVTRDGAHILYHNPGADSAPSDIGAPRDTPALYANPDGSGASAPFGSQLAQALVTPVFAPNGNLAVTTGSGYTVTNPPFGATQMKLVAFGGQAIIITGSLDTWRGDSAALVIETGAGPEARLYDIATGQITLLEANTNAYLWGN